VGREPARRPPGRVEADPFFRHSIRVDGVFTPAFLARVKRDWGL
jgi:hypothetical protein